MTNEIYEIVKKHIDEYDYMELLASGCPSDEFDSESEYISGSISENCSIDEIAEVIARTFEKQFSNPEKSEDFLELARRIHVDLTKKI